MHFKSILAVTDLSVDGDHAVERAAQIASSHGATLELLYAPMSSSPVCADPATRMAQSATAMSTRHGLTVHVLHATGTTVQQVANHAMGADLLVISSRRESTLKALLCGQPAIRLARLWHGPVLVAQPAPRLRFRRILVAVDFAPPSQHLAELARAWDKDAQVELFHAVNTVGEARLRQADVCPQVMTTYRQSRVQSAQVRMSALTESLGATATGMLSAIGRGDPARQAIARQELVGADLLVVGKQRSTTMADFFLGSTARRILGHATCDVLVVPYSRPPSTRASARLTLPTPHGIGHDTLGCANARAS